MQIQDNDHFLPSISTRTDESTFSADEIFLDFFACQIEYQRCMAKRDYQGALDQMNQLFELLKQKSNSPFDISEIKELHFQRAHACVLLHDYDAAAEDLLWIERHEDLENEHRAKVLRGLVELLGGKGTAVLEEAAYDPLALLVLDAPENRAVPKTDWYLLNQEDRIRKLLQNRHYEAVIEEINQMVFPPTWGNYNEERDKWIRLRGVCHALRGHFRQAIDDFDTADSFWQRCDLERAIVYARAGQKEDAAKILNKAFDVFPFRLDLIRQLILD